MHSITLQMITTCDSSWKKKNKKYLKLVWSLIWFKMVSQHGQAGLQLVYNHYKSIILDFFKARTHTILPNGKHNTTPPSGEVWDVYVLEWCY